MGDKAWTVLTGPLVDCPLYINDPKLAIFAKWRLITHI
jgi:hypothetical protein